MDNLTWKDEIKQFMQNELCTDSDIEDFVRNHPDVNGKEIWDYVSELNAPKKCKGCEHIQMSSMYPCNICVRQNQLMDYYEAK